MSSLVNYNVIESHGCYFSVPLQAQACASNHAPTAKAFIIDISRACTGCAFELQHHVNNRPNDNMLLDQRVHTFNATDPMNRHADALSSYKEVVDCCMRVGSDKNSFALRKMFASTRVMKIMSNDRVYLLVQQANDPSHCASFTSPWHALYLKSKTHWLSS